EPKVVTLEQDHLSRVTRGFRVAHKVIELLRLLVLPHVDYQARLIAWLAVDVLDESKSHAKGLAWVAHPVRCLDHLFSIRLLAARSHTSNSTAEDGCHHQHHGGPRSNRHMLLHGFLSDVTQSVHHNHSRRTIRRDQRSQG